MSCVMNVYSITTGWPVIIEFIHHNHLHGNNFLCEPMGRLHLMPFKPLLILQEIDRKINLHIR